MSVYVTTEEAREFVSLYHPEGAEIPEEVQFESTSNHLASAVIWAAMGEPGQEHNIGQLFRHFSVKSPGYTMTRGEEVDRPALKQTAQLYWELAYRDASARVDDGKEVSILHALQFSLANQWNFSRIVFTFAVDSLGTAVNVNHTGGIIDQDDRNYTHILRGMQQRIDLEFHRDE